MHGGAEAVLLECPDLVVGFLHVAYVLVYDPVKSAVFDRLHDIIIVCDVDNGWLVVVVLFHVQHRRRARYALVPVAVIPFDVLPKVTVGSTPLRTRDRELIEMRSRLVDTQPRPQKPQQRLGKYSTNKPEPATIPPIWLKTRPSRQHGPQFSPGQLSASRAWGFSV